MKKICCLFSFFMYFVILRAVSQDQKDYFGVKGGMSMWTWRAKGADQHPLNTGYSSRLGPDFAVFYEKGISQTFSFMPSLEFSSQGRKKDAFQAFATPDEFAAAFPPGNVPPYLYADYNSE